MASLCTSALRQGSRSLASKSKSFLQSKSLMTKPVSSSLSATTRPSRCASRMVSILGGVESLVPLHSAIASARLKSNLASDTCCWSWLSQGTMLVNFGYSNFEDLGIDKDDICGLTVSGLAVPL